MEVRPRRAREAFWRCEHVFARCTSDMADSGEEGGPLEEEEEEETQK
jgi:hypothetical protein